MGKGCEVMRMIHLNENQIGEPFIYPEEEIPGEVAQLAKSEAEQDTKELLKVFIYNLAVRLLAAKNPKLDLICLCYLSGFDMVNLIGATDNTQTAIANTL